MIGAIAAAVAAGAAWKSTVTSVAINRETSEALGRAIAPEITVKWATLGPTKQGALLIANAAVADVEAWVRAPDGTTAEGCQTERIPAYEPRPYVGWLAAEPGDRGTWMTEIRRSGGHVILPGFKLVARYSDDRRLGRWEAEYVELAGNFELAAPPRWIGIAR